jgi:hypothetical protein
MSDVWYFAQYGKPVGPMSIGKLKANLSGIPNREDVLVWRNGFPAASSFGLNSDADRKLSVVSGPRNHLWGSRG